MAGIGIRDNEWPIIDFRGGCALFRLHAGAKKQLISVGGEQSAHDRRSLVWHLAERVAGEVCAWIFGDASFGRSRPTAQVDAFDAKSFDGHGLSRRVGTEGRDRLARLKQLSEPGIKALSGCARHRIVGGNGASLLNYLTR